MGTKEKILEALEDKRTEAVWELIHKAVCKIYRKGTHREFPEARKEYLELEDEINNPKNRFIIVEDYNIDEGFNAKFYEDIVNLNGKIPIWHLFEDYFSDTGESTGFEAILLVDIKEMRCYLIDKEIKYHKKEIKIK